MCFGFIPTAQDNTAIRSSKFLGIQVGQDMSLDVHIDAVGKKINCNVYTLLGLLPKHILYILI